MTDTGIAILSTGRSHCLKRLLKSIEDHTDKGDLHVFVIDDSLSSESVKNVVDKYSWVEFIHTGDRIGIARNTNEAMDKLKTYDYKMILNNDMEILKHGWREFYIDVMIKTNFHHFCFQQMFLWGAGSCKRPSTLQVINGVNISTIQNHPQGALLIYDQLAFETVGYFDSDKFKSYGKSHWMWSFSISESRIQPPGIHDVIGSNTYFKVHDELCSTPHEERVRAYKENTLIFNDELHKLKNKKRPIYTPKG